MLMGKVEDVPCCSSVRSSPPSDNASSFNSSRISIDSIDLL